MPGSRLMVVVSWWLFGEGLESADSPANASRYVLAQVVSMDHLEALSWLRGLKPSEFLPPSLPSP
jgi:hypothetical protein